jgi:hypothetical protein
MPQVRMAISCKTGSGKSQVVQAFLWHTYQHNWEHMIAVMAFAWKAALHLSTSASLLIAPATSSG